MRLSNIRTEERGGQTALVADVASEKFRNGDFAEKTIWVSVPNEYGGYLAADRYDAFLLALLAPAMFYGDDIEIAGAVSKRLLRNVNTHLLEIMAAFSPRLRKITVVARETAGEPVVSAGHNGTGFSGGVDSFCTIYENYVRENDPEYKIGALLFLNVGAHGLYGRAETKQRFENLFALLKPFPDSEGLPFVPVDSNFHFWFGREWCHAFVLPLTLAGGVLALQKFFKRYYMASAGQNYDQWTKYAPSERGHYLDGFAEPYLCPLLSTESTKFVLDGIRHSRVEKTLKIAGYPPAKRFLNVCLRKNPEIENCGVCDKCKRTLLTLSAAGLLEDFGAVFNLGEFGRNRRDWICGEVYNEKTGRHVRYEVFKDRGVWARSNYDPDMDAVLEFHRGRGVRLPTFLEAGAWLFWRKWFLPRVRDLYGKICGKTTR